ncbi:MAG: hypothetical protein C5B60_11640 [Chloroflexi bacterium]|nr:MAG: hypothetical protein C5B60_11640 [Chloroflexota bacterium]
MDMVICEHDVRIQGRFLRIAALSADTYEFLKDPVGAVVELKKSGTRIDLFTFMQKLPETSPLYPYPMEWDNLAVLSISSFEQWWTKQINDKTRNMAPRAAKKGVEIREVSLDEPFIEGVWAIYNECEVRQGKRYPHYGKDLKTVHRITGTFLERSAFIGAYMDDRLIGFAKLHWDETCTQAGLESILSMAQHRDKAPTNALIARAVRYCADRGIPYLVYSRYSDGNKQWDSLMDFKAHNGFKRVDLPRYYVAMTRRGWMAFHLGLHRRILDHIPETIVEKLRVVRSEWYRTKSRLFNPN